MVVQSYSAVTTEASLKIIKRVALFVINALHFGKDRVPVNHVAICFAVSTLSRAPATIIPTSTAATAAAAAIAAVAVAGTGAGSIVTGADVPAGQSKHWF